MKIKRSVKNPARVATRLARKEAAKARQERRRQGTLQRDAYALCFGKGAR